jgi:hypothetical protein
MKEYATECFPEQYQVCLTALDEIIKRAFEYWKIRRIEQSKRDFKNSG